MSFHVGQKVVCVDDCHLGYGRRVPDLDWIVKGEIYTVSCTPFLNGWGNFAIHLTERPNKRAKTGFHISRFRPVIERKTETGMAILREIIDRESHQDKPPVKRTLNS